MGMEWDLIHNSEWTHHHSALRQANFRVDPTSQTLHKLNHSCQSSCEETSSTIKLGSSLLWRSTNCHLIRWDRIYRRRKRVYYLPKLNLCDGKFATIGSRLGLAGSARTVPTNILWYSKMSTNLLNRPNAGLSITANTAISEACALSGMNTRSSLSFSDTTML